MNKIRTIIFILIIIILIVLIFIILPRYIGNKRGQMIATKPAPVIFQPAPSELPGVGPPGGRGSGVKIPPIIK